MHSILRLLIKLVCFEKR